MLTNHEMTFVCFGIAKVQCQKLNIIEYFFSLSYMPMHDMLNKRKYAKKKKSKKNQNALYMIACLLGDVGVIGCTSKVIGPIKQL